LFFIAVLLCLFFCCENGQKKQENGLFPVIPLWQTQANRQFWSLVCFVASDLLTTICHLAIVNVCLIIILSIDNTQTSILLLCFQYIFVELMITMNE